MPNGLPHATTPVLIKDDVASEAMTLDLLCRSLGVETVRTASTAEAAAMPDRTRPGAIATLAGFITRAGLPIRPSRKDLH